MNPESVAPLTFIRRGQPVTLRNVPPERTLLQVLREDLHLCATKEGCNEGDCGACTVVLAQAQHGQLHYRAVNSCIRLAHSVAGMAVITAEDLAEPSGQLHPAQQALVQCHGSQCGFCTPGFVMSLFALYQTQRQTQPAAQTLSREQAQVALSGNLCRCTGYRPILDAAQTMQQLPQPADSAAREADTLAALQALASQLPEATETTEASAYLRPRTLAQLLQWRARYPQAQVVAGCTDVGLWVTKQHRRFDRVLDLTATPELQQLHTEASHLHIGAAVSLTDAFVALVAHWPTLETFSQRFAGLPVRNAGTLGGNVANGSPIGDSMPLLIALHARVVLMRWQATPDGGSIHQRQLPLEDLYTGYRTNVMQPDELLCAIQVPLPQPAEPNPALLRVYKISKRFDDDISAVCLAIQLTLQAGRVQHASIGAGGVAATPVRARQTEAALLGQPWNADTVQAAMVVLRAEFQPISDMRASAHYRRTVLGNLLQRFWFESQGHTTINLEHPATLEALA